MIKRHVPISGAISSAGRLVGAVGVAGYQRPDLVDERIGSFDAEPGQLGLRTGGRNLVAAHSTGGHLGFIPGVGVGSRGLLVQVLFDQAG